MWLEDWATNSIAPFPDWVFFDLSGRSIVPQPGPQWGRDFSPPDAEQKFLYFTLGTPSSNSPNTRGSEASLAQSPDVGMFLLPTRRVFFKNPTGVSQKGGTPTSLGSIPWAMPPVEPYESVILEPIGWRRGGTKIVIKGQPLALRVSLMSFIDGSMQMLKKGEP
ncbi:hypothetical protein HNY73_001539 [Argiope bruennichi]|uniref:Uncharacterized protein n=1 Tax=Argiope bruennichi TaxID=94029 RepID=A0A8T0G1P6_ARGBR|nr:hypothetical protein HNY73_001539 [Argiope bruennichi]